jgi:Na+/melibiose symporter-like transporter
VGGIIFAILYPLSRKEHQDVVHELEMQRQKAQKTQAVEETV